MAYIPIPCRFAVVMGSLEISGSTISRNIVENCLRVRRRRWRCSQRPVSALPGRAACDVGEGPGRGAGKRCGRALAQAPGELREIWAHRRLSGPGWAGPTGAGERGWLLSSRPAGGCPTVVLNERCSLAKITPPSHLPQSKIVKLEEGGL